MIRRPLLVDAAIAALVAVLVLVLTPGLAIAGVIGLIVLAACAVTWLFSRLRRRSRRLGLQGHHHSTPRRRLPGSR